MAVILPGVVMTLLMMITVAAFTCWTRGGSDAPFDVRQLLSAGMEIVVVLSVPLAISFAWTACATSSFSPTISPTGRLSGMRKIGFRNCRAASCNACR